MTPDSVGSFLPTTLPPSWQRPPGWMPSNRGRPAKSDAERLQTYLANRLRARERARQRYAAATAGRPKLKPGPKPTMPEAERRRRRAIWRAAWEAANRERRNEWRKEWRRNNPEQEKRARQRRAANPVQNLSDRMRSSIRRAFTVKKLPSDKGRRSWESLVGYTAQELITHIEKQFKGRMSWKNFGRWHVDHIVPVASFRFQSVDDPAFRACWALTNLRPLWAPKNQQKAALREHLV